MTTSASVLADMAAETEVYQISICGDCWVEYLFSHTPVDRVVVDFVLDHEMSVSCNTTRNWEQSDVHSYEDLREHGVLLPEDVSEWSGFSFRWEMHGSPCEKRVASALSKIVSLPQEEQDALIDAYKKSLKSLSDACFG